MAGVFSNVRLYVEPLVVHNKIANIYQRHLDGVQLTVRTTLDKVSREILRESKVEHSYLLAGAFSHVWFYV